MIRLFLRKGYRWHCGSKIKKRLIFISRSFHCVRTGGLEPTRLAAPDPKSGLATSYNTSAYSVFDNCAKIVI